VKKSSGFIVALSLLFLSSPSWAQSNLAADPQWRTLVLAPLGTAAPPPAHPAKSLDTANLMADPDCSQLHVGDCVYDWYPEEGCCLAPPVGGSFCPNWCP
jgi:hypothetical protein